ncbi:MAG: RecQ family ATP-dependent DNA helicase [Planctomycetes bacterium]|nr:RecQ family ATP-dependent DNA helicase [Planctomycetota bacterium]
MTFLAQGLGIDLELTHAERLTALGACRADQTFHRESTTTAATRTTLADLDAFAAPAAYVFGHNILWHDLPWLSRRAPDLALLHKPAVDTLVLSAIAFAEHPYHALVKDYKLARDAINDPVADARLAGRLLDDARTRLRQIVTTNPTFGRVVHTLGVAGLRTLGAPASEGFALALADLTPACVDLDGDLRRLLAERICTAALRALLPAAKQSDETQLALLFAIAWLRVGGTPDAISPSVMMPWVRHRLPQVTALLRQLRDIPCEHEDCTWCRRVHEPAHQLRRWFGYADFRAEPALPGGGSAQRAIVVAGFQDRPLLALLPTGGGKSLCFQLPAIQRHLRRGCLSVVISPLQSLMHDQVDNFAAKTGAQCAVALTGRLSAPERRAALDAVRSGQAGLLYVAPEQLRNPGFEQAIALREIGAWVFDEAHCVSKWGHDFRPDYLYAARFVREFSQRQGVTPAPVVCVTATAKPEVRDEILQHFRNELGQELQVFDGHAARANLTLRVEAMPLPAKVPRLRELVAAQLAAAPTGSVLVYTATRGNAEKVAALLRSADLEAEAFHAGLDVPQKKAVQERFLRGENRVVCATNAFGMGIDKPDIRLVVHFEIPGSIEAYVQEVGRAGRDGEAAEAVLLFAEDDIETQFRLAASARLDLRDLRGILRRIRSQARPTGPDGWRETICTSGEILQDEALAEQIDPTDRNAPTRVVTAIAWLERGKFLRRDENATTVFQGRPRVQTLAEAQQRIDGLGLPDRKAAAWLAVMARLIAAEPDEGLRSDDFLDLPDVLGVLGTIEGAARGRAILRLLIEMQKAGLLSTGMQMTAFVRHAVASSSSARLERAIALEGRIVDLLRTQEPEPETDRRYPLHLQSLVQALAREDDLVTRPEAQQALAAMADRAQHAGANAPGLRIQVTSHDHATVQVRGTWEQALATAQRRHSVARVCLQALLARLPDAKARSAALLVEFELEDLLGAIDQDLELRGSPAPDRIAEVEYALLFLHRTGAIVLHKGLAVFRQAMVLRVPQESAPRPYSRDDFQPLAEHQDERTVQIHAMHEFARRMTSTPAAGLQLLDDYFRLPREQFFARYFARRRAELERATSAESWRRIVADLSPTQRRIVEAGEHESLLVLAGPGSGKTRVVVHRCAYLLRVKRVPARAILVLCFNRSAALELRRRLGVLVGDDARGVLVQTYHGMAARLVGRSPADLLDAGGEQEAVFDELIRAAVAQLEAGTATAMDTDGEDLRERLLHGFRHILVDEYQDIDAAQYQLVSAIAGRTLRDPDRKLTALAVGDDDQNIYEFRHTSVEFLRQFEADYGATRMPLVENYRSTAHILDAANQLIAQNDERLKHDTPIRIDGARQSTPPGGRLAQGNHPAGGRVQILELDSPTAQARAVADELRRLKACDPEFAWERCAVLSPRHALLDPVRTVLEDAGIPVRRRIDPQRSYSLFRLREVQAFLGAIAARPEPEIDAIGLQALLVGLRQRFPREPHVDLVAQTLAAFREECGGHTQPSTLVRAFFGEVLLEQRRERTLGDGVMLSTVHGAKGAECDHVLLLDGGWQLRGRDSWAQQRRLYYVGMTRARQTLTLMQCARDGAPWVPGFHGPCFHRRPFAAGGATAPLPGRRYELLGLADIALSFAGRAAEHEAIAETLHGLATGDALRLEATDRGIFLAAANGVRVGALAKAVAPHWRERLPRVLAVRIAAILVRRRQDEGADYQDGIRREAWQVVVPEITLDAHVQARPRGAEPG